jgi:hypothetical protein
MSFWKIYHKKIKKFGKFAIEIGIMAKLPWIYGTMP